MENKNGIESALANLIQLSSEKGFLVFDDIYDEADKWFLSIRDVDYLSTSIVEDYGVSKYTPVIATLLKNPTLILPQ